MTGPGRLLVTGGAGFIGSHIVEAAQAAGWVVAALDNLLTGNRANLPAGLPLYEVDVRDAAALRAAFQDFRPTVVSHQAAQASVSISVREPGFDAEVNILGGLNVLAAAQAQGVRRLVFASSGGTVYGEVPDGGADEHAPTSPSSPYAISKLAFEQYLQAAQQHSGLDAVTLRYANVYGPRQNPHGEAGVVAIFAARLLARQALQINGRVQAGDDGCVRDYVYVGDVVRANLAAALGQTPRLLNVGSGVASSTRQIAEQLAATLSVPAVLEFAPPRAGDLQRAVLDAAHFKRVLGAPLSLREGLDQTARWLRARPGQVAGQSAD